jgi:hypothetical protein
MVNFGQESPALAPGLLWLHAGMGQVPQGRRQFGQFGQLAVGWLGRLRVGASLLRPDETF